MFRTVIFVLLFGLALVLLTGCATSGNNAEHGSVTDSVTVHMNCREETKAYRGDPSEIDMFKRCMERHGYTPDGNTLENPVSSSDSMEQRLGELNDLKAKGLITEAEYKKKTVEILKDL